MSDPMTFTSTMLEADFSATPVDDRNLSHPHRTDHALAMGRPETLAQSDSGSFGLTVFDETADAVFDSDDGSGVAQVRRVEAAAVFREAATLESDVEDLDVVTREYGRSADFDEDTSEQPDEGIGFVLSDDRDQVDAFAEEGGEAPKGGAVFDTN